MAHSDNRRPTTNNAAGRAGGDATKGHSPAEPLEYSDPHSLAAHVGRHLAWLKARGYGEDGLWTRRADLMEFLELV